VERKLIEIGQGRAHYNVARTRILKYSVEIYHKGLNEHKIISAPDTEMLENKVNIQAKKWIKKWEEKEAKRKAREEKEANREEAERRTQEAIEAIKSIENLLNHTLSIDDTIDWDDLKRKETYTESQPTKPKKPRYKDYPEKPDEDSSEFNPTFNIFEKIIKSKKVKKLEKYKKLYNIALEEWKENLTHVEEFNKKIDREYEEKLKEWEGEVEQWGKRKEEFYKEQNIFNEKIDKLKDSYLDLNQDAVVEYCEMVLNNSEYPDDFPKNFELEYNPENKLLIIEYQLPTIDEMPKVKEVKYITSRNELKELPISVSQLNKMYDEAVYKITLRTIHELLEADSTNALKTVTFNGWVDSINKATGKRENKCILSVQTSRKEFLQLDLSQIDPKACFKNLKGVACAKLSTVTPIQPILNISKEDKRFIDSYNVSATFDSKTNIAAMDWEDFEHLIRELFEKEFLANGGEVKVTRGSRDGGVDAIAFDPDPIRGGKIVIQAKRYTNTVGVSAVRDLYGTLIDEGATKGILVTTSDYGSDAYNYSKDKPITLLNGSNLLHMLSRHGHHVKIDLKEAKRLFEDKQK